MNLYNEIMARFAFYFLSSHFNQENTPQPKLPEISLTNLSKALQNRCLFKFLQFFPSPRGTL